MARKRVHSICTVENCGKKHVGKGFCNNHLKRFNRNGDPVAKVSRRKHKPGEKKFTLGRQGYVNIWMPNHPNANKRGYMREHIYVMSQHIKRPLFKHETVHHKNGIRDDNRLENLELWSYSQPYGQRVEDKISFYKEFLQQYGYTVTKEATCG